MIPPLSQNTSGIHSAPRAKMTGLVQGVQLGKRTLCVLTLVITDAHL